MAGDGSVEAVPNRARLHQRDHVVPPASVQAIKEFGEAVSGTIDHSCLLEICGRTSYKGGVE